jgi:hypothetical protein
MMKIRAFIVMGVMVMARASLTQAEERAPDAEGLRNGRVPVAASHPPATLAALPYSPSTVPFDNEIARVELGAAKPNVTTQPHVHLTNRVMIYLEAGTNTIRYQNGDLNREVFRAGDVQWNDAMGTHTATVSGPVDIVHVELKSPPKMVPSIRYSPLDPLAVDPKHFKVEIDNNQVRVLRMHLDKGEKAVLHEEPFERLLVSLTTSRLKVADQNGNTKTILYKPGEVRWLKPGTEANENVGGNHYEAIIVEFKK